MAILSSFNVMNCIWLLLLLDHREPCSSGLLTIICRGWYRAECELQESMSYVSLCTWWVNSVWSLRKWETGYELEDGRATKLKEEEEVVEVVVEGCVVFVISNNFLRIYLQCLVFVYCAPVNSIGIRKFMVRNSNCIVPKKPRMWATLAREWTVGHRLHVTHH